MIERNFEVSFYSLGKNSIVGCIQKYNVRRPILELPARSLAQLPLFDSLVVPLSCLQRLEQSL